MSVFLSALLACVYVYVCLPVISVYFLANIESNQYNNYSRTTNRHRIVAITDGTKFAICPGIEASKEQRGIPFWDSIRNNKCSDYFDEFGRSTFGKRT